MYSLNDYGRMIADSERFAAYEKAIAKTVRPGDVVAEIGCGPGVFSLLACRAGARRVFAIDTEDFIEFARQLAAANGFAERIQFFQSDSRKLQLPERVDVIVSDIRGSLPFFGHAIASIEDARQRLLAPQGRLIPQRDTLKAAVIEAGDFYSGLVSPWSESNSGLNLSPALLLLLNGSYSSYFAGEQILTDTQSWAVLDYSIGAKACAAADLNFVTTRSGTAHGICMWFETELLDGIGYSAGPGARKNVYGQVFLPWLQPVPLAEGQNIQVRLQANLVGDDYIWCWDTKVPAGANGEEQHFRQSTFLGASFTPQALRRRTADFVPTLSEEGRADRFLLAAMDGKTSLQQMAEGASRLFPTIFPKWEDALSRAAELGRQFSR
jgi:protein arginine N-methyltransferase 1